MALTSPWCACLALCHRVLKQGSDHAPEELDEAAYVDGASALQAVPLVYLPADGCRRW